MIPKYFTVKRDNSTEWKKYIEWLNKTYNTKWGGDAYSYYGFNGSKSDSGTYGSFGSHGSNNPVVFNSPKEFMELVKQSEFKLPEKWCIKGGKELENWIKEYESKNNTILNIGGRKTEFYYCLSSTNNLESWDYFTILPSSYIEITFEQFKTHVLKQTETKMEKTYTVKKEDLKKIWNVACPTWQKILETKATLEPFSNTVTYTQEEVNKMFEAATIRSGVDQKTVLEEVFGKQEEQFNSTMLGVGEMMYLSSDTSAILKTYSKYVDINNPSRTWDLDVKLLGKKVPSGTEFKIIAK